MRPLKIGALILAFCSCLWSLLPFFEASLYIPGFLLANNPRFPSEGEIYLGITGVVATIIGLAHWFPVSVLKRHSLLIAFALICIVLALAERFLNARAHALQAGVMFEGEDDVPNPHRHGSFSRSQLSERC